MKTALLFPFLLVLVRAFPESPAPSYIHSQYDDQSYQAEEAPLSHGHSHGHSPHGHSHGHGQRHEDHEVVIQQYHHPLSDAPTKIVTHGHPSDSGLDSAPVAPVYRAPSSSYKRRPVYHAPSHSHSSHGHSSPYSQSHAHSSSSHRHQSHVPKSLSSYELPSSVTKEYHQEVYPSYKGKEASYSQYAAPASAVIPVAQGDDYGVDAYSPSHSEDYGSPNSYQNSPLKSSGISYAPPGSSNAYASPPVSHSPGYSSYAAEQPEYDAPVAQAPVYRPKAKGYRSPSTSHSHSSAYSSALSPYSTYGVPAKTATYGSSKGSSLLSSYGTPKTLSSYGSPKLTYSKPHYGPPKATYIAPTYSKSVHSSYQSPKTYYRGQKASGYRTPSSSYSSQQATYGAPSSKGFGYSYTPTDKGYVRFDEHANGGYETEKVEDEYSAPYGGAYDSGRSHY